MGKFYVLGCEGVSQSSLLLVGPSVGVSVVLAQSFVFWVFFFPKSSPKNIIVFNAFGEGGRERERERERDIHVREKHRLVALNMWPDQARGCTHPPGTGD